MSEPNKMYVFTTGDVSIDEEGRPISVRADQPRQRVAAIPMNQLRSNVSSFMEGARRLMDDLDQKVGAYQLAEVEISAQIGADGKVGFLGSGMGIEASASFKLKLTRNPVGG